VAFAEDLTQFFDTDDFGVAATYNGSATVNGIFDNGFSAIGNEPGVEGSMPAFTCRAADIPSVAHGDTLVISAVTYTVVGVHPDGTGVVTLALSESS
jgi:hypothetical protein